MTERVKYKYAVKEDAGGEAWIACEPLNGDLSILKNGFLGFELPEGTTYKRAQEIASFLSDNTIAISFTKLR